MLRVRFAYATGNTLVYSVERLADGLLNDFGDATFKASPGTAVRALPEGTGIFSGRYADNLVTDPAQFTDGAYCVTVHDAGAANAVVAELVVLLHGGDDAPVFPGAGTGGTDPWATPLPGTYPAGTAGAILGGGLGGGISLVQLRTELDARDVDTVHLARLDTAVSTRYAGGAVASVTAPVTVGTNNDKAGYTLAAAGLDAVPVEPGVNARQALAPILAAAAGVLSGAGTGTIVIKGGNVATTRITATTDNAGNRTAATLTLPP